MNRLGAATSPYLLQHKDNPVHWWEWDPEAFAEARERDVPVLLSVGYAACHWCHVMAHESFEDQRTADYLNEHFVSVKVDREERPDVDAVYMQATQALTGQGGWPMTCFLTPDAEPFYAGTYFPDSPRHGQPAFLQVCGGVVQAWRERRDDVARAAGDIGGYLRQGLAMRGAGPLDASALASAVEALAGDFDQQSAGFGGAPKFPPSMVCEWLLRHHERTGSAAALDMVARTCRAMARGGIYDQLGGGFARYSVDRHWVVPHFEKMLYDNVLLLRVYTHWWRLSADELAARVVRETADFLLAELRTPEGGFASALDADTDGVEGRYYVWTPAELREVLGEADGTWAATLLEVTPTGTFEHGASTLQLPRDPDDRRRWGDVRQRLRAARDTRTRPALDDKVVAAWNGLAVTALAEAGALLGEPAYVAAAEQAARLLVDVHLPDESLRRVSRDGVAGRHAGVLEDYGCVAAGLLDLYQVTGQRRWLEPAEWLLAGALGRFRADDGGFYDTAADAEALVARPRDPTDNASPSGQSAITHGLLSWAALSGDGPVRDAAEAALRTMAPVVRQAPRFAAWSLAAAEAALSGPMEIAVVGQAGDRARDELVAAARAAAGPGAVVVVGAPGDEPAVPLLADRGLVEGRAAAYVCRGMVCRRPVTTVADLHAAMSG